MHRRGSPDSRPRGRLCGPRLRQRQDRADVEESPLHGANLQGGRGLGGYRSDGWHQWRQGRPGARRRHRGVARHLQGRDGLPLQRRTRVAFERVLGREHSGCQQGRFGGSGRHHPHREVGRSSPEEGPHPGAHHQGDQLGRGLDLRQVGPLCSLQVGRFQEVPDTCTVECWLEPEDRLHRGAHLRERVGGAFLHRDGPRPVLRRRLVRDRVRFVQDLARRLDRRGPAHQAEEGHLQVGGLLRRAGREVVH
mmetsp:Transcript_68677/g.192535  ORF Transcript_68677/g.192535 Transcript_68677/m.192535 type:complete len:250 (-) Transcript_68677:1021-1770(-)